MMKKMGLLSILAAVFLIAGCNEDPKIETYRQKNAELKAQLEKANDTIAKKEKRIDKLKSENTEIQQKALDSIRIMMEKQNAATVEKDKKLKTERTRVKELEQKIEKMEKKQPK